MRAVERRRGMAGKGREPIVIMTTETNPEVLAICYAQGWCANSSYMTDIEAEAVTDIGEVFYKNATVTHFEEFYYFGVHSIGSKGFQSMSKITSLVLPPNITIANYGVYGCSKLKYLEISEGTLSLGGTSCFSSSFDNVKYNASNNVGAQYFDTTHYSSDVYVEYDDCLYNDSGMLLLCPKSKTSVTFKTGITGLDRHCMKNNKSASVVIPEGVTDMGNAACETMSNLTTIELPSTLASIPQYAFYQSNSKVNTLTCHRTTAPSLGNYCFGGWASNGTLYVPTGATGYGGGKWDTYLFNKGWTLEYLT